MLQEAKPRPRRIIYTAKVNYWVSSFSFITQASIRYVPQAGTWMQTLTRQYYLQSTPRGTEHEEVGCKVKPQEQRRNRFGAAGIQFSELAPHPPWEYQYVNNDCKKSQYSLDFCSFQIPPGIMKICFCTSISQVLKGSLSSMLETEFSQHHYMGWPRLSCNSNKTASLYQEIMLSSSLKSLSTLNLTIHLLQP